MFPQTDGNEYENLTIKSDGKPVKIFLTKGKHCISMQVTMGALEEQYMEITAVMNRLNKVGIDLKKLTAGSDDVNRTWDLNAYLPDVVPELESCADCHVAGLAEGEWLVTANGKLVMKCNVTEEETVAIFGAIAGHNALEYILCGGLLLGAFFMATDYSTSPCTSWGKIIFGIGCGLLTFIIRQFGGYNEGVSFAILIMNILTPYITALTKKKPFGTKKVKKIKAGGDVK
jgi:hypothetical protein